MQQIQRTYVANLDSNDVSVLTEMNASAANGPGMTTANGEGRARRAPRSSPINISDYYFGVIKWNIDT